MSMLALRAGVGTSGAAGVAPRITRARCLMALLLAAPLGLQAAPAFELPFASSIEPVIEQGEIEGQAVRVARFSSRVSPEEALRILRREWRGAGTEPLLELRSERWQLVSTHEPASGFRTLQLRAAPGGGSEGLLSVWESPQPRLSDRASRGATNPGQLLPATSRVVRRFSVVDAGRRSETLVAVAQASVEWVAAVIRERVAARGFVRDPLIGSSKAVAAAASSSAAAAYRRGDQEIAFTVSALGDGGSGIVLHLIGDAQ